MDRRRGMGALWRAWRREDRCQVPSLIIASRTVIAAGQHKDTVSSIES